ncbi:hypothetical protein CROQUDRAFT_85705 [Cronartium quercuum f. sp. fusiforme G11]|uniref:Uncharacterized protein n=1 Tax=Cronartium quercuum f. sp. fusiforme G11 TaxID=708437 RepID=A0A9P6NSE1_9BASI|nr:hypothetical protein CROQUDRAFT_85705 [Cronartium quercuum f. sp. fusiforme G11]
MWAYTHTTAAHLYDQIPNTVMGTVTPFEALFNRKPTLDYLRTFGYPPNKKGWTFWDPESKTTTTIDSSLAKFLSDLPPIPSDPTQKSRLPPDSSTSKAHLTHVLNAMTFSDFDAEQMAQQQDGVVDMVATQTSAHGYIVPKTFTKAM